MEISANQPTRNARPGDRLPVVGYARVSTQEQAAEGVSLAAQRAKLEGYASLHDLDLVAVEEDAGISAKTLDRPGLRAALARIERGEARGLLIAKLDRLSRSVRDWNDLIERYFSERTGSTLMSVGDSIDTTKAAGRLVLNVLMSVAQWEREAIAERTRDALDHKRARGERIGTVPYGSRVSADGVSLELHSGEVAILAQIRDFDGQGFSLRAIAHALNDAQVLTRSGRPWNPSTIHHLLNGPRRCLPVPQQP